MTIGKTTGNTQIAGAPSCAPHIPTATIARMWSIPEMGCQKPLAKPTDLPAALVGENREWVKQKAEDQERAAGSSCRLNEVFHGRRMEAFHDMIPKSIAAR